ncbi:MAG TPA: hypothetical protein VNZ58_04840 [Thermomicrobiales bacterium]|nr:hypothetical protein [Thermomicrobiales bacterium]
MSIDRSRTNESEHHDEFSDDPNATEPPEPVVINDIAAPENAREDATTAGVIHRDETRPMHTQTPEQWSVDVGVDVLGACGHKIGEVVDVRDDCVVVEKGFFMPEDIFVPKSAISGADEHHLMLNVTKDSVDHSDWDEDPDEADYKMPERRVS